MKKIVIIIVSALALLLVAFGLYLIFFSPKTTPPSSPTYQQIKPLPSPTKPPGNKFSISTSQGNVEVNNFFSAAKIIETAVYLKETANYVIIYNSDSGQFLIALYGRTAGENNQDRQNAETDFLNILGVTRTDACKLNVDQEVSNSYDNNLSGTNYQLSFCPNSLPIPGFENSQNQSKSTNSIR